MVYNSEWNIAKILQNPVHTHPDLTYTYFQAVAWCPWDRNMIATGGGSSDKTIRFWNVSTGKCTKVVETKSQVQRFSGWLRE